MRLAAVVLAGGAAVRLAGRDKATIEIEGRRLLDHVVEALGAATDIVVVGPELSTSGPVIWAREEPVGGGPVAGLAAGYAALPRQPDLLAVAAVDMPRLSTETFDRLLGAITPEVDGAFLVAEGRRHLAGVLRPAAINWPSSTAASGMSMRRFLADVRLAEVPAVGQEARDVDTDQDLRDLRRAPGPATPD